MDSELDIIAELPQVDDIPLSQLLALDRAVLTSALERVRMYLDQPQEAVTAFANFVSVHPG